MRRLISQNIVSRGFFVGTLFAVFCAVTFLVPFPAFAVAPNTNPVRILSEDFESGNFSKWTFCDDQIQTSVVHSGTRAHKFLLGGLCHKTFAQTTREVYVSFWWHFPTNFNWAPGTSGKHFWRLGLQGNEQYDTTSAGYGDMNMDIFLGGTKIFHPAAPLKTGSWFKLEFYTRLNDPGVANGEAKVWVDGVLQLNQSNVNLTATTNNIDQFLLTTNYDNCTGTCHWYMDDVEVWNGCPSGSSCKAGSTPSSTPISLAPPSNLKVVP
ncbi:MAG: polysaccharide lyase [Nitrososphaera sp.]|nr:polysaccharide lyase [Nitrososphaera sp.]